MGFNDWIYFEHAGSATTAHAEEVESALKSKLASKVQERLRSRISPGLNADEAVRAGSIRAQASAGGIVIDEDDQAKLLAQATGQVAEKRGSKELAPSEAMDVNDLFRQSDGVPKIVQRGDGSKTVAFRTIDVNRLFGEQIDMRDQQVQKVVTDTLQGGIVDSFEESIEEIERTYPSKR